MWRSGMVAVFGLGLGVLAAPGWSDEIYSWTDAAGRVHYTNAPSAGGAPADEHANDTPAPEAGAADPEDEAPAIAAANANPEGEAAPGRPEPVADPAVYSTEVSLRRNAIERDLRAAGRRLRELDGDLATVRGHNAGGAKLPPELRSEEENALLAEREQVTKRVDELRAQAAKLRGEVTARLGELPAWWVDVRTDQR